MTKDQTTVSDGTTNVSDKGASNEVNNTKDSVAFETHRKLLGQHKNLKESVVSLQEKLAQYEAKERQAEELEAVKKGDYEKALAFKDKRIQELEGQVSDYEEGLDKGKKLNAVLDKLPGKLKHRDYMNFIDTESLVVDPSSGVIDEASLEQVVNGFVKNHGSLLDTSGSKKLPGHARVGDLGYEPKSWRDAKTTKDLIDGFINQFSEE